MKKIYKISFLTLLKEPGTCPLDAHMNSVCSKPSETTDTTEIWKQIAESSSSILGIFIMTAVIYM